MGRKPLCVVPVLAGDAPQPVSVVLGASEPVRRAGLARWLTEAGAELLFETSDPDCLLPAVTELAPAVLTVDLSIDQAAWLAMARGLRHRWSQLGILGVVEQEQADWLPSAMGSVVTAAISSRCRADCFRHALEHAAAREFFLSHDLVERLLPSLVSGRQVREAVSPFDRLTPRETVVLRCIERGDTIKEIAFSLGISAKTVYVHRTALLKKLGGCLLRDLPATLVQLRLGRRSC